MALPAQDVHLAAQHHELALLAGGSAGEGLELGLSDQEPREEIPQAPMLAPQGVRR